MVSNAHKHLSYEAKQKKSKTTQGFICVVFDAVVCAECTFLWVDKKIPSYQLVHEKSWVSLGEERKRKVCEVGTGACRLNFGNPMCNNILFSFFLAG